MNKLEQDFLNSKIETEARDWRQSLAIEKFEYKKQQDARKEAEKIRIENQKRSAQNTAIAMQIATILLKICFWICFAPILAIGFFFIGFFKAVIK